MFIVVLSGFFAVAFVHAQLVAGQHELDTVRSEIAEASAQRATVERAVDEASAPHEIVDRATEIGMVRAVEPVYLAANGPVPDVPEPVSFSPDTESTPAPDPLPDPEPRDVELIAAPASDYDPVQDAAELASVETVVETADPVPSTADETDGEVAVGALPVEAEPRSGLAGAAVTTGSETPEAVLAGASTSDQPTSTVAGSSAVSEGVASG